MEMPPVQVQNVNPVPDLGTPREGQNLVHRNVPEIQSPAQVRVRFDREEAKCAVEDPLDLGLLPSATDQSAANVSRRRPASMTSKPVVLSVAMSRSADWARLSIVS